jgi:hypothetical protein
MDRFEDVDTADQKLFRDDLEKSYASGCGPPERKAELNSRPGNRAEV